MTPVRVSLLASPSLVDRPGAGVQTSIRRAMHAEQAGMHRVWFADAPQRDDTSDTRPLVHVAMALSSTSTIRIGLDGTLAGRTGPEYVSDAFRTLEQAFPGRIDARLGQADAPDEGHTAGIISMLLSHEGPPIWVLDVGGQGANDPGQRRTSCAQGHFFDPHESVTTVGHPHSGGSRLVAARVILRGTELAARTAAEQFVAARRSPPSPDDRGIGISRWSIEPPDAAERALRTVVWGTPTQVADHLKRVADRAGADEVMVNLPEPDSFVHGDHLTAMATALLD